MQAEGSSIEYEFVLAPDLVDINDREIALGDTRHGDIEPDIVLLAPIRRAVRHDQQFRSGLGETFDDFGSPDVLANRNAKTNSTEIDRAWQGSDCKDSLLVEDAVVRQIDFETDGMNCAGVEQAIGIVKLSPLDPWRPDQDRGPTIGCFARKLFDLGWACRLKSRFEH